MTLEDYESVIVGARECMQDIVTAHLDLSPDITFYQSDPNSSFQPQDIFRQYIDKKSTVKSTVVHIAHDLWCHSAELYRIARDQRIQIESLSKKLIESQESVINLQKRVIDEKTQSVTEIKTAVESCVAKSVGSSFKSYSEALGPSQATAPVIPAVELKRVMKGVVEDEDRSRNVVIFGVAETASREQNIDETVSEIMWEIGEKPRIVGSTRIGLKRDGVVRPVLVTFGTSVAAQQVIRQAKELRESEKFEKVYIGPDRTREERAERKGLVTDLKKKRQEQTNFRHYIKGNEVISIEKDLS